MRAIAADLGWPLRRAAWSIERRLLWPLQDLVAGRGRLAVALLLVASATVGALACVVGGPPPDVGNQVFARSGGHPAAPAPRFAHSSSSPSAPTLEGPSPDLRGSSEAKPPDARTAAAGLSAAATPVGSAPRAELGQLVGSEALSGSEARALEVAERFAEAFVSYEVGGDTRSVRNAMERSATPALARALAQRPPRQPATTAVPRARVLNVVAGPRRGAELQASVSLERLEVTSELRLTLRLTATGWRVSEVLG
jgi:hypothetical protein